MAERDARHDRYQAQHAEYQRRRADRLVVDSGRVLPKERSSASFKRSPRSWNDVAEIFLVHLLEDILDGPAD